MNILIYISAVSAVGNHLHQELPPATVQWAKGLLLSAQKQDQIDEFMLLDCSRLLRTMSRPGDLGNPGYVTSFGDQRVATKTNSILERHGTVMVFF